MLRKLALFLASGMLAAAAPAADRSAERDLMVLTIENMAASAGAEGHRRIDRKVLDVMRQVPRHLLVPEEVRAQAYRNTPLPIGYEATISQPYIVALMTDLMEVEPHHKVFEVGTGSGYQAAVLGHLAREVYSIEIVEPLAARAAEQLKALGHSNVHVRAGDGYAGWPEHAPFDRIIVTAGADHVPQPLLDQLAPGGRMVIPLGRTDHEMQLTLIVKNARGRISRREVLPVRFVPLVRASELNGR